MSDLKCLVTVPDIGQNYDSELARLSALGVTPDWRGGEVNNSQDGRLVGEKCRGYDIVVASNERWDGTAFEACRDRLRLLVRYGIGFDNVDLAAASRAGVPVTNLPGCNADSVAEMAVTLMLAAARNLIPQHEYMKGGAHKAQGFVSKSILGKTVGLLGLGHIGKAVTRMLKGFGCRFLAYDAARDEKFAREFGVEYVSRERVLSESDIVSVHLPLTPETKWTIDRDAVALMKPTAIVVNTSRGGLVNSDDLAEALRGKRIYAAGLDVFENEVGSEQPIGHQFLGLDNVVMTPHTAAMTYETFETMMRFAVDAVEAFLAGRPLPGLLNPGYAGRGEI